MYDIDNAFVGVPLGGNKYCIMGRTPFEMLHLSWNRLFKHQFRAINQLIGPGDSKKKRRNNWTLFTNSLLVMLTDRAKDISPNDPSQWHSGWN